jgi:uncharacterized protein (TIGR03067 family)
MLAMVASVLLAFDTSVGVPELQGVWRLTSVEAEAGPVLLPEQRPLLTIKGNQLLFGGEEFARVSADAATEPHVFDVTFRESDKVYEGIYTLDKDGLKICLNGRTDGVKERPNSFALEGHPVRRMLSLERAKPGEEDTGGGFVGIALRKDDDRNEIVIFNVIEGSPAKKAGVLKEDVLLSVGGAAVTELTAAVAECRRAKPRSELSLRLRRNGEERELKVKVGVLPFAILTGLD